MRHLYPVYCIPEVELNPSKDTAISTVEFCKLGTTIVVKKLALL